jgi:hypothetical protein
MSGGSYNYLCWADLGDIGSKQADLEAMAARLDGINPDSHAATDTREVLAILAALDFAIRRLSDVWKAVEWRDSYDYADDQMMEAITEYEAQRAAEDSEP